MLKKILITLIPLFYLSNLSARVVEEYYFGTFEDGTPEGFVNATVTDNPGPDDINPSSKVILYTAGPWWGPSKWKNAGHFTTYHSKLRVDVYLPEGALQQYDWSDSDLCMFILHARNCASGDIDHWQSETHLVYMEESWITLEFELSTLEHFCYRNLILASSSDVGFYSDNYRWVIDLPNDEDGLIFRENFEGFTFPPLGWTTYDTGTPSWQRSSAQNHNPLGHYSAVHPQVGFDPVQSWLISPGIQIPEEVDYEISFFSLNTSSDWYVPGIGNSNSVWVSLTGNDPQEDDFQKIWQPSSVGIGWEQSIISLHQYSGQEIYIAFVFEGNLISHSWYLDNITLYEGEPRALVYMQAVEDCAANYIAINLEMDNPMPTSAFQFDFVLPQDFTYVEGSAFLHRHDNHQVYTNVIADSLLRIIAFSPDNSPFPGDSGLVLSFDVHAANEEGMHFLSFARSIVSDLHGKNVLFRAYNAPLSLTPSTTFITGHPNSQTVLPGDEVSFQVAATGENLSYQWYFNNMPVEGATMPVLHITNITQDHEGEYYCLVTGDCGILKSQIATLTVIVTSYEVSFYVREQEQQPVENAEIIIAQNDTLFTNYEGFALTTLTAGSYPFSVYREGFNFFNGLFFVTNSNVIVNVDLIPLAAGYEYFRQTMVFPNPFRESIFLQNPQWSERYVITDLTGIILTGGQITNIALQEIDTSLLKPGIYFLILYGKEGEKATFKIVKNQP